MDEWAKSWLIQEREKGARCLEIKYISGKPYVYHSTSRYDKTTRSPRKVSIYLGRLTEEQGLIPKGTRKKREPETVTWIVEPPDVPAPGRPKLDEDSFGERSLFLEEAAFLIPQIKKYFLDCPREFIVLLNSRIESALSNADENGRIPGGLGGSIVNDPEETCHVLARIGRNTSGQQAIFSHLSSGSLLIAYPFSLAGSSRYGVRACASLLFVEADSGLPVMVWRLPGACPDMSIIAETVLEPAFPKDTPTEIILYISHDENMQLACQGSAGREFDLTPCVERGIPCISLLPHESSIYDIPLRLTDHFTRGESLILTGSTASGGIMTHLFKDVRTATEEADELYSVREKGVIDRATLKRQLKRAGRKIIQSSMRAEPEEIYDLWAFEGRILTSVTMIREQAGMEPALGACGDMDEDAMSGSLFLSMLAISLIQRNQTQNEQN